VTTQRTIQDGRHHHLWVASALAPSWGQGEVDRQGWIAGGCTPVGCPPGHVDSPGVKWRLWVLCWQNAELFEYSFAKPLVQFTYFFIQRKTNLQIQTHISLYKHKTNLQTLLSRENTLLIFKNSCFPFCV
jgi:hypothetical protein